MLGITLHFIDQKNVRTNLHFIDQKMLGPPCISLIKKVRATLNFMDQKKNYWDHSAFHWSRKG